LITKIFRTKLILSQILSLRKTLAKSNKNPLEIILNTILAKNHKTKDFFTKDEVFDIFEKFTNPKG